MKIKKEEFMHILDLAKNTEPNNKTLKHLIEAFENRNHEELDIDDFNDYDLVVIWDAEGDIRYLAEEYGKFLSMNEEEQNKFIKTIKEKVDWNEIEDKSLDLGSDIVKRIIKETLYNGEPIEKQSEKKFLNFFHRNKS